MPSIFGCPKDKIINIASDMPFPSSMIMIQYGKSAVLSSKSPRHAAFSAMNRDLGKASGKYVCMYVFNLVECRMSTRWPLNKL